MENQIVLSLGNILSIIAGFGVVFAWFYKLLSKKFDGINGNIKEMSQKLGSFEKSTNQRIENTNQRITEMKTDMNQRLLTIEGYLVPQKVFRFEKPFEDEPKEN